MGALGRKAVYALKGGAGGEEREERRIRRSTGKGEV